jgi:hypothetical protein
MGEVYAASREKPEGLANKLVTIHLDQSMIVSLTSFKSKEVTISTAIILLRALVVHTLEITLY